MQTYAQAAFRNDLDEALCYLYDLLMGEIEPELMLEQVAGLEEKYKDETPTQKKARMERYRKAHLTFDQQYALFLHDLKKTIKNSSAVTESPEADTKQQDMLLRLISEA